MWATDLRMVTWIQAQGRIGARAGGSLDLPRFYLTVWNHRQPGNCTWKLWIEWFKLTWQSGALAQSLLVYIRPNKFGSLRPYRLLKHWFNAFYESASWLVSHTYRFPLCRHLWRVTECLDVCGPGDVIYLPRAMTSSLQIFIGGNILLEGSHPAKKLVRGRGDVSQKFQKNLIFSDSHM